MSNEGDFFCNLKAIHNYKSIYVFRQVSFLCAN